MFTYEVSVKRRNLSHLKHDYISVPIPVCIGAIVNCEDYSFIVTSVSVTDGCEGTYGYYIEGEEV